MGLVSRILPDEPVASLAEYQQVGGGAALETSRTIGPEAVIDAVEASGLRGRGGAGFPTGTKWRTVAEFAAAGSPATVVVNGAEGEPGTFKDRTLLRRSPYAVLEGALIAAGAVGATRVIVAMKESFTRERGRVAAAIDEIRSAGWSDGVEIDIVLGPGEYLFGEETGLLEVLDGRPPFPRIAPPFRHGLDVPGNVQDEPAGVAMAHPGTGGGAPTLANNVETLANVPLIVRDGPEAFRSIGTGESPGSILCTISGATQVHAVGEIPLGTTLAEAIELIGGGPRKGRRLVAAMSGVANPIVPEELFGTPLTYEAMLEIESGLGAAGFIVFDDETDLAAVAAGASRFLAVESCGQCTPCKQDGLTIAGILGQACAGTAGDDDIRSLPTFVATVSTEARCYLAQQHENVIASILRFFPATLEQRIGGSPIEPEPILPIVDMVDGEAILDLDHLGKQPDWTFGSGDSGKSPVDRLAEGGEIRTG